MRSCSGPGFTNPAFLDASFALARILQFYDRVPNVSRSWSVILRSALRRQGPVVKVLLPIRSLGEYSLVGGA